jgi:hypothetical protein
LSGIGALELSGMAPPVGGAALVSGVDAGGALVSGADCGIDWEPPAGGAWSGEGWA